MSDFGGTWSPALYDLVWVQGGDAISFIDGQVSQDVASMVPGEVRRSLILEPRGKLRGLLWVLRGADELALATWAGTGDGVAADLERFLFRVEADITVDAAVGAGVWGSIPGDSGTWSGERSDLTARLPERAWPSVIVVGRSPAGDPAGPDEVALARVRAGEPVFGMDVDESTIPQETGVVPDAVSFTKGCYLGQELVARIDSRGHVNRLLRRIVVGRRVPTGATIEVGGEAMGTLGTVAPDGNGAEGLALVRREVAPGDSVTIVWDDGTAPGRVVETPHTLRTEPSEDGGTMEPTR